MAKAQFHKNQRVYVQPVGTWALIEHVIPQWAKGLEEPIRIYYDVGLGREFGADELRAEQPTADEISLEGEVWRVIRARNKWQEAEECAHHPYPGSYPTIVTGEADWGGWRVPGAEYDLNPDRIEMQGRIMSMSLRMLSLLQKVLQVAETEPENLTDGFLPLIKEAKLIVRDVLIQPDPDERDVVNEDGEAEFDAA